MRLYDGVAFGIERHGADGRPVARAADHDHPAAAEGEAVFAVTPRRLNPPAWLRKTAVDAELLGFPAVADQRLRRHGSRQRLLCNIQGHAPRDGRKQMHLRLPKSFYADLELLARSFLKCASPAAPVS